ncbi:MAG: hypothetical protein ABFR31_10390 [Thermodesulfobacteriota bacterium]
MLKKGSTLLVTTAFVFYASTCSTVYAKSAVSAGTSLPKGKAFQTIQSNLNSLQDQINEFVGKTDSFEERVVALETAVIELQKKDEALQVQIDANEGDITELQGLIDDNASLIANIEEQIAQINITLAEKQNIINGECEEGASIIAINEDGSIVCGAAGVAGVGDTGELAIATSANFMMGVYQQSRSVTATCPNGYQVTGGGFSTIYPTTNVYNSKLALFGNGWTATFVDNHPTSRDFIIVYARCAKLE